MLAAKITTHVQDAQNRLLQQYKNQPRMQALLATFTQGIQDLEDSTYDLDALRQLYNGSTFPSFGAQLDGLGQIFNVKRNNLPDNEYLILILGTIAEDNSDTTPEIILNVVQILFQAGYIFLKYLPPAAVGINVGDPTFDPSLINVMKNIIQNSLGGGISLEFIVTYATDNVFRFRSANGPNVGQGFGSANEPGSGGAFGHLIFNNLVE